MNAVFYTSPYTQIFLPIYEFDSLPADDGVLLGGARNMNMRGFATTEGYTTYPGDSLTALLSIGTPYFSSSACNRDIKYLGHESPYPGFECVAVEPPTAPVISVQCAGYRPANLGLVYLCIAPVNGVRKLGFLCEGFIDNVRKLNFAYIPSDSNVLNDMLNELTITEAPGEKGFKPVGNRVNKVIGGGKISGTKARYTTDALTQPGAPDESSASIVGSGFLNVYSISAANLAKVGECLFGDTLKSWISNTAFNPLDAIVSLQIFPCAPTVSGLSHVKLFHFDCVDSVLGANASAGLITKQFEVYDFGTLTIPETWESFLDYDATNFSLYLPFIGSVDIPVSEVMGGSINVQYTVDFLTGICVANVLCTKLVNLPDDDDVNQYAQHSYMGNCSMQIPITQVGYGNIIGSLMQAAAMIPAGVGAVAGSLANSALSGGFKPTVETKGSVLSNAGFCSVLQPYITVTRPISAEPEGYQETIGYPSYVETTLGDCEDLCVCDSIDLSGISGATDSEMNRIRQLCMDGVYV